MKFVTGGSLRTDRSCLGAVSDIHCSSGPEIVVGVVCNFWLVSYGIIVNAL